MVPTLEGWVPVLVLNTYIGPACAAAVTAIRAAPVASAMASDLRATCFIVVPVNSIDPVLARTGPKRKLIRFWWLIAGNPQIHPQADCPGAAQKRPRMGQGGTAGTPDQSVDRAGDLRQ